jgi:cytidylate kinase
MPFITISRMYGSGGERIAAVVARELGWELVDNGVIDAVAERSGLTRDQVFDKDERVPSIVERLAAAISLGTPESMPAVMDQPVPTTEEEVLRITGRVIEEAVQRGPAVIVGRGAQCLLAERKDALHVFCYADAATLARNAIADHAIAPADAERKVHEMNRQREQYVRRHWQRDWRAVENYHLCVHTGWLGADDAAALIARVARDRLGAPTPHHSSRA